MSTSAGVYRQTNPTHLKYVDRQEKEFMTIDEARDLSVLLAQKTIETVGRPDLIIGLANGANFPVRVIASELSVPYTLTKARRRGSGFKRRLRHVIKFIRFPSFIMTSEFFNFFVKAFDRRFSAIETSNVEDETYAGARGKHVLIVDDCIDTGSSIKFLVDKVRIAGAARVSISVLCWSNKNDTEKQYGLKPDVFLHRRIHYYPWSNNSPYYKEFIEWSDKNGVPIWE